MTFDETSLEKRLMKVTNTQDGIQSLSLWLLHYKVQYKKIIDAWAKVLEKAKVSHRLTLVNLANDIIQNARRKI
ncbi:Regulation of nuclear pre-mRNA domain-containing protein 1B [Halotydeus destructor]|nr:Regulation of nuclear pre-mRNA domain-containing protein 1B [Halotydeus destructor]